MIARSLAIILTTVLLFSCGSNGDKPVIGKKPGKADMEELNRYMIQKDRERIRNYIERKGLSMTESSTGLWYQVTKQGEGNYLTDNSRILMYYDCSLLDGTKCYSSEDFGPKDLIIGRTQMEAGLNEGLRALKPGAEAVFILPPYLAFGLPGDGRRIPPRSILVYNVNILQAE